MSEKMHTPEKEHNIYFKQLFDFKKKAENDITSAFIKINNIEQNVKIFDYRMSQYEKQNEILADMAISLKLMTQQLDGFGKLVGEHANTIDEHEIALREIKYKPAQESYEDNRQFNRELKIVIVSCIVTAILTFIVSNL